MTTQLTLVNELLEPVITGLGYEFVGIELLRPGRAICLRIYIDSPAGITITDCEQVSRQVSATLDVEDPIRSEYVLEVSSPGLDRPLFHKKHYEQFIGEEAKLKLIKLVSGARHWRGVIKEVTDEAVFIENNDGVFGFSFSDIKKANLIPKYTIGERSKAR